MASEARLDLKRSRPGGANPIAVAPGRLISLDDGDGLGAGPSRDGGFQKRGLARAGRAHDVHGENSTGIQMLAIVLGGGLVRSEQRMVEIDCSRGRHRTSA